RSPDAEGGRHSGRRLAPSALARHPGSTHTRGHSTAIGRPQRSEAAPYYFGYIDRIKSEDVLGVFEQQLRDTSPRLDAISEEQSLARYEPGKWSIRELLGHVSDAERVFLSRAFWFARGFDT